MSVTEAISSLLGDAIYHAIEASSNAREAQKDDEERGDFIELANMHRNVAMVYVELARTYVEVKDIYPHFGTTQ